MESKNDQKLNWSGISQKEPLASILLLTKNGEKYLEECLKGVFSQSVHFPYEVIAVDSGSTDQTLSILSHYPVEIHQIKPSEFRHGRTRNLAASFARGKFLVFLTQDATPANERWLGELVQSLENTPGAAGAYSRWLCRREGHVLEKSWIEKVFPSAPRIQKMINGERGCATQKSRELIFFSNVSSCIYKAVWDKMPFSDEVCFAEDQLWAKQVIEAGYSIVYQPISEVYHSHNDSLGVYAKRFFESGMAFGLMSTARKVPVTISCAEVFSSMVQDGRRQNKGPLGVFFLMVEAIGRYILREITNVAGFCCGVFLRVFTKMTSHQTKAE